MLISTGLGPKSTCSILAYCKIYLCLYGIDATIFNASCHRLVRQATNAWVDQLKLYNLVRKFQIYIVFTLDKNELILQRVLFFERNHDLFKHMGEFYDNYYLGVAEPIINDGRISMSQFLVDYIETMSYHSEKLIEAKGITEDQSSEIGGYFGNLDPEEYTHWHILSFTTIDTKAFVNVPFTYDQGQKYAILHDKSDHLYCPIPEVSVINQLDEEVDISNVSRSTTLTYCDDPGFPRYFMNDQQISSNIETVNSIIKEFQTVFNENGVSVSSFQDIVDIFHLLKSGD